MTSYKAPGFQERQALARQARIKALDQLRAKPPVDEAHIAARQALRKAREDAAAEQRIARLAAREQAKADKLAQSLEAAARKAAAMPKILTEAEKKAARDARYAARKSRASSR